MHAFFGTFFFRGVDTVHIGVGFAEIALPEILEVRLGA
jgi:hypothetical protein